MAKGNKQQFCVIGLGAFGFSLAKNLAKNGAYVLAIDNKMELIEEIQFHVADAVCLDATDAGLLEEHGVTKADVVIIAIGELFEPVVLIAMELLEAGVPKVIARAGSNTQEDILNRIGVNQVIHPEYDEGKRMAKSLMRLSVTDYFELAEGLGIYEIEAPRDLWGYNLVEIKLRQRYKVNLLTIKRPKTRNVENKQNGEKERNSDFDGSYEILGILGPKTEIKEFDKLVLMGTQEAIDRLLDTNE